MDNGTLESVNITDCPEVLVPNEVFFAVAMASLSENLLVVAAVISNRNLHSPMYCFICSLALFNTISSLSKTWENVMLVFTDAGQLDAQGDSELKVDDVMDTLLCMSFTGSICSFLAIAVDRYITIFHALRYHNIMTMRRVAAALAAIWTLCGVSSAIMVHFSHAAAIIICFIVVFLVCLVLILFLYMHMFLLARQHARRIATFPRSAAQQRGGMRGALTVTILFGVFVACWAPFFFHLLIITVCPQNPYCECYRSLFQVHLILMMSHAVIDPAIYAFRSAELRSTFRRMLYCSNSRAGRRCLA
ncbi:adrenocorticotropic hormone receptor [Megalops cyprinoides]|uniref:adrenocorticotropic hormone receptor n=1 Tax=Megalops cyprinoides TaxID=118141 RepID=UPI0018649473|nr:adrenocorticotropic hormone receptor [Megalops cyprinoides]